VDFSLEQLETILMKDAEKRGERFYRVILRAHDDVLFARTRLCVELGRMEKAFNVVRVSPDESAMGEFPDRVVFHVTTAMSFEKAATAASASLNGAVDIVELPFAAWKTEKSRWQNECGISHPEGPDRQKIDIALIVLSYKVLRFDMERISRVLAEEDGQGERARKRMKAFERRLEELDASSVLFLSFKAGGERYLMPRFMISGYRWKDEAGAFRFALDRKRRKETEAAGSEPATGLPGKAERFGLLCQGEGLEALCADRLVSYREIRLQDLRIVNRRSELCFDVEADGEPWRLVLPERGAGDSASA
jgi:hypothetical protein